eukprot:CAMPEP_0204332400 /NCGR_PEP_ID=MMETSP0469-20131031/16432_1 /ASSEMBLY_ACC=CAM_ASM_000384 /TAXON_ID=2969 /ORGANISM="Oxyrrhis marina" /LENGTH=170 /DNA_ID=CAMNT_0051315541 /DNA_START=94 /DNA_END=603 /DNA_ORIENTATION=+
MCPVRSASENHAGAEGARHFATAIRESTTLRKIFMNECNLGDEGLHHLSRALRFSSVLYHAAFEGNNISDIGAQFLATELLQKQGSSIRSLSLAGNQISADGLQDIADVVEMANTGSRIDLRIQGNSGGFRVGGGDLNQQSVDSLTQIHTTCVFRTRLLDDEDLYRPRLL